MSEKQFELASLPLSASVQGAIGGVLADEKIPAWQIVSGILNKPHSEYAGGLGGKLMDESGPVEGEVRTINEWFQALDELFNLELVKQKVKWLDGRLTIWGLAQLDPNLKAYLDAVGFLFELEDEYGIATSIYPGDLTKIPVARSTSPAGQTAQNDPSGPVPETPPAQVTMKYRGINICVIGTHRGWKLPADGFVLRAALSDDKVAFHSDDDLPKELNRQTQAELIAFLNETMSKSDPPTAAQPLAIDLVTRFSPKILPFSPTGSVHVLIASYKALEADAPAADVRTVMRGLIDTARTLGLSNLVMPVLVRNNSGRPETIRKARRMLNALLEISEFSPLKSVTIVSRMASVIDMAHQRLDLHENNLAQALANDRADGEDMLNISAEVYALADTLLLREVHAPLAVGVMGGWGSGKSFVMYLLKKRMAYIRARPVARGWPPFPVEAPQSPFVGHVYQINFNAWTYAKSNLWPSLMHTIFFELNRQISLEKVFSRATSDLMLTGGDEYKNLYKEDYQVDPKEYEQAREIMDSNLLWLTMRGQKQAELQELRSLEEQIASQKSSRETASKKQVEKIQKELGDQAHFAAAEVLKAKANALAGQILDAEGRSLLLSKGNLEVGQVETLLTSLRSLRATWGYIFSVVKKSRANTALALLLAIFLVGSLITNLPTVAELLKMDWLARLVAQLGALVAVVLPVLRLSENWSLRVKEIVQEYQSNVDTEMKNWQATRDAHLAEQQAKDEAAVQKIISAPDLSQEVKREKLEKLTGTNVAANDKLVEILQSQAEDQRRKVGPTAHYLTLLEFVRSRLEGASYESQLGLMHQVKQDFDELTASLMRADEETQKLFPRGEPRIVLFIDDLDRCPPPRVVEVLEAVQLLLNTQLFVIVLGLDTRYVTRALEKEYKEILKHEGDPSGLDYIEKIIQIPYRVRPMEAAGVQNYLQQQMQIEALASEQRQEAAAASAETPKTEQKSATEEGQTPAIPGKAQTAQESPNTKSQAAATGQQAKTNVPPATPQLVEFSAEVIKFQQGDLDDLTICCQQVDLTPRSVKRLVNVLKLIKIFWFRSLGGDRTRQVKQTVMSLLALSAAYPEIMREIFVQLDSYFRSGDPLLTETVIAQLESIKLQNAIETGFAWQLALFRRDVKALQVKKFGTVPIAELEQTTLNIVRSFSFVGDPSYWTDQAPEQPA